MTNYTLDIPNIDKQLNTIKSFYDVFQIHTTIKTYIFCDEKPLSKLEGTIELYNKNKYDDYKIPGSEYETNLKNIIWLKHATFIKASSLCDGYKKAIDLKPNFAEAHNNMGIAFKGLNQLDDALKSFQRAVEINPKFASGHYNLGNIFKDLGDKIEVMDISWMCAEAMRRSLFGESLKELYDKNIEDSIYR